MMMTLDKKCNTSNKIKLEDKALILRFKTNKIREDSKEWHQLAHLPLDKLVHQTWEDKVEMVVEVDNKWVDNKVEANKWEANNKVQDAMTKKMDKTREV